MNVLINKDTLYVVAKHESATALRKFAWLELPHETIVVCACDEPDDFEQFADFQLRDLYGNITGQSNLKAIRFSTQALQFLLFDAIEKVQELDATEEELVTQADKITKPYAIFKYVKGSNSAAPIGDQYAPTCPVVERDEAFEAAVHATSPIARPIIAEAPVAPVQKRAPAQVNRLAAKTEPAVQKLPVKPAVDYQAVASLPIKQPWL